MDANALTMINKKSCEEQYTTIIRPRTDVYKVVLQLLPKNNPSGTRFQSKLSYLAPTVYRAVTVARD